MSDRGALDVLVVRTPHEHEKAPRLIGEELTGASHDRRSVDPRIGADRDPQVRARTADQQHAFVLDDPAA
jgi:hypothetical protein